MTRLLAPGGALSEASNQVKRGGLFVVHLTVFMDLLCFSIILPLLPLYALELDATGLEVGALLSCYAIAQLVGAPVLGRLSDRIGRRPVLIAALAGTAISMAFTGFAETLPTLLAARTLAGVFGGSISAAQAYIADVTSEENRARAMGLLGASIGMGFVAGPALGAFLDPWGFAAASFCAAGIAGANAVLAVFVLAEPERSGNTTSGHRPGAWVRLLTSGSVGRLLWSGFFMTLAFVAVETAFPLLGDAVWGLVGRDLGMVFAYIGVVVIITQGGLVGPAERGLGARNCAVLGAVGMFTGLALMSFATELGLIATLAALGIVSGAQGLLRPTLASMLSIEASESHRGAILGAGQGVAASARAAGPLLAGWLYDSRPAWPFAVAALSALCAGVLLLGRALRNHARAAQ